MGVHKLLWGICGDYAGIHQVWVSQSQGYHFGGPHNTGYSMMRPILSFPVDGNYQIVDWL